MSYRTNGLGVSVGELSKMITNQDKLNNMTDPKRRKRDLIRTMEELGKEHNYSVLKSSCVLIGVLSPLILIKSVVGGVGIIWKIRIFK